MCGRFSFDMPHPVSLMTICSRLPLRHKLILTFPKAGVNFMAFDSRLLMSLFMYSGTKSVYISFSWGIN